MSAPTLACDAGLETRARQSLGTSNDFIYQMVDRAFDRYGVGGGHLVDVGCGSAGLWQVVGRRFSAYTGLDAVRYDGFPPDGRFHHINLDASNWLIAEGIADVVAAVETIEHLENPWAFVRQLAALVRTSGWVVVTTPNQLSALSLLTLGAKRRFSAFQDRHYPAHRTALLESDLQRAASEAGLHPVEIDYSLRGRFPLSPWHYPQLLARVFPRRLSDNLMLLAKKIR
jgi:2-polyprenyl-3-methyl-5-hydroxy-6-metoxy-1,4-benzoquinol methylase